MRRAPPLLAAALASGAIPAAADAAARHDAEARGRRIVSTAFVMIGPDGHLTVEQHDGRAVVLRDVTMGAKTYCGRRADGGTTAARVCGRYRDVAAARPGGGPSREAPLPADGGTARSRPDG